jgi:hypothetical protein
MRDAGIMGGFTRCRKAKGIEMEHGIRIMRDFPGQDAEWVELTPNLLRIVKRTGTLPPFYTAHMNLSSAQTRKCSDAEVWVWALLLW